MERFQDRPRSSSRTSVGTPGPGAVRVRTQAVGGLPPVRVTRTSGVAVLAPLARKNTRSTPSRPATRGTLRSSLWVAWVMYQPCRLMLGAAGGPPPGPAPPPPPPGQDVRSRSPARARDFRGRRAEARKATGPLY
jgi:hypothetical protein